jgi:DNA-binding beta-propeller fold protein YncE
MPLQHRGFVALPTHAKPGGFDHAAVHDPTGRMYVAHTANDAVDVIDIATERYVGSTGNLPGVAGVLIVPGPDLIVTSNRGENTIGFFSPNGRAEVDRVGVGVRPNGLAFDPRRARLLVAHVGDPTIPGSYTVSIVDVHARKRRADLPVAGRTRWAIYDPVSDAFYVNIADPPQIVVIGASEPIGVRRVLAMPHAGPHGLDLDVAGRRLFCACDAGVLLEVHVDSGAILGTETLAGVPDVVFVDAALDRLYVAIGDPGVIDVFDTRPLRRHETIPTESGAHTLASDAARHLVYAFLPASHRAAVYEDHA